MRPTPPTALCPTACGLCLCPVAFALCPCAPVPNACGLWCLARIDGGVWGEPLPQTCRTWTAKEMVQPCLIYLQYRDMYLQYRDMATKPSN